MWKERICIDRSRSLYVQYSVFLIFISLLLFFSHPFWLAFIEDPLSPLEVFWSCLVYESLGISLPTKGLILLDPI